MKVPFSSWQHLSNWTLTGLLMLILSSLACSEPDKEQQGFTLVRADKAVTIQATGTLVSKNSAYLVVPQIPNMWNFRIDFLAPEGQQVKAGDPVIRFNNQELSRFIQNARQKLDGRQKEFAGYQVRTQERRAKLALQVAESRAQAKKLKSKLLVPDHLVERAELEKDRLRARKAALALKRIEAEQRNLEAGIKERTASFELQISQIKNSLDQLQLQLAQLEVKAPRNGMVVHKRNWRGKRWQIGDETYPGATIAEIPDLNNMEVEAVVEEVDAGKVAKGQTVAVRLDAYPDQRYRAEVEDLGHIFRSKAYNKPSIVFDAVISLHETDPELMRPGMATTLELQVDQLKQVLFVPRDCVTFRDGKAFVRQGSGWQSSREVQVQLGRRGGDWFEIVAGIEAGGIILRGAHGEVTP